MVLLALSTFPSNSQTKKLNYFDRIMFKFRRERSIKNFLRKLEFMVKTRLTSSLTPKAKVLITCSKSATQNFTALINNHSRIVQSYSYDFVLAQDASCSPIKSNYLLFLDEDLIQHSDFVTNRIKVEDETQYYRELNVFFAKLKTMVNIPEIVIAAHPRADIGYTRSKFQQHSVIQGDTASLVKHCSACITSASTATNFAVIFRKPIISITTDRLKNTRPAIAVLADHLGLIPVNISKELDNDEIQKSLQINERKYRDFLENHIRYSGSSKFGFAALETVLDGEQT